MQPFKTILVPVDFSAPSARALGYARQLGDAFGATLHVLHVLENPFAGGGYMEMYASPADDYIQTIEREARARLESLLTDEQKARYSAVLVTRMGGSAAQQILEYAKEHGAIDLIVMATSGRGGVARLVMGSVTDKIVRTAPCPVLTVHDHDRPDEGADHRAA